MRSLNSLFMVVGFMVFGWIPALAQKTTAVIVKSHDKMMCTGDTLFLDGTQSTGATHYEWEIVDGLVRSTDSIVKYVPSNWSHTVRIKLTVFNGVDTSSTLDEVNVLKVPSVEAGKYKPICSNSKPLALDRALPNQLSGTWYYSSTQYLSSNLLDPKQFAPGKHILIYKWTVPGTSCSASDSTEIVINPAPTPELTSLPSELCTTADPIALKGTTSDTVGNFVSWKWLGSGIVDNGNGNFSFDPSLSIKGKQTLYYLAINKYECRDSVSSSIAVREPIQPGFTKSVDGKRVQFQSTSEDADAWKWEFGDGQSSELENPIHTYPASTTYQVTLTATSSACGDTSIQRNIETWATGIESPVAQLHIYPNPTSDVVYLKLEDAIFKNAQVRLTDVQGRVVMVQEIDQNAFQLQLGHLDAGVYQVVITNSNSLELSRTRLVKR